MSGCERVGRIVKKWGRWCVGCWWVIDQGGEGSRFYRRVQRRDDHFRICKVCSSAVRGPNKPVRFRPIFGGFVLYGCSNDDQSTPVRSEGDIRTGLEHNSTIGV